MTCNNRYVIAVILPDRVGILRDVSRAVYELNGRIDGITQTVLGDTFSVTLTAAFDESFAPAALTTRITQLLAPAEPSIVIRPHTSPSRTAPAPVERYVLTLSGSDHPGVLQSVTGFLVDLGINVEDWQVGFSDDRVLHIAEITVPARLDIQQLQDGFRALSSELGQQGSITHENIFRATHEIGPIKALLTENRHDS